MPVSAAVVYPISVSVIGWRWSCHDLWSGIPPALRWVHDRGLVSARRAAHGRLEALVRSSIASLISLGGGAIRARCVSVPSLLLVIVGVGIQRLLVYGSVLGAIALPHAAAQLIRLRMLRETVLVVGQVGRLVATEPAEQSAARTVSRRVVVLGAWAERLFFAVVAGEDQLHDGREEEEEASGKDVKTWLSVR